MDNRTYLMEKFGTPIKERGTEMKFVCPKCEHKALLGDSDSGLYFCFICSFGKGEKPVGTTQQHKRFVDYDLHLKITRFLTDTLVLSDYHREYLRKRGIAHPERYKLGTVPFGVERVLQKEFSEDSLLNSGFFRRDKTRGLSGWPVLKFNRLFIPIFQTGVLKTCKTRVDPREDLTHEVKYAVPYGARTNHCVLHYEHKGPYQIYTEGEFKALASSEYFVDSAASSGVNSINALINLSRGFHKRRFVIFDKEADESNVISRTQALSLVQNIDNGCLVRLKAPPGVKAELDTFLLEYGYDALIALMEDSWKNREEVLYSEKVELALRGAK